MAKRWELGSVRDALDVGCGVGHWGTMLAAVMSKDVRFTGVDREPAWVQRPRHARGRWGSAGVSPTFEATPSGCPSRMIGST